MFLNIFKSFTRSTLRVFARSIQLQISSYEHEDVIVPAYVLHVPDSIQRCELKSDS